MKNKNKYNIILENSYTNLQSISEETESSDLNSFYNQLISGVIEQSIPNTIASAVCSVQPLLHPGGAVLGVRRSLDTSTNEIKINVKKQAVNNLYESKYKSIITIEAGQDLKSIINSNEFNVFLDAASAESADKIDSVIVPVLRNLAKPIGSGSILLDSSITEAGLQILYIINLGLAEINSEIKRGMVGFAIVSPTLAAVLSTRILSNNDSYGTNKFIANISKRDSETSTYDQVPEIGSLSKKNPYYIGTAGNVEFYVDPMAPTDSAVIGYKGTVEGESAVIYAPYQYAIQQFPDADTGNTILFSSARFGYMRNPLDTGTGNNDSDFLRRMEFDCSQVGGGFGGTGGTTVPHAVYNYARDEFTATAGQTDFDVSGSGLLARVFVEGVMLQADQYTFSNPTVHLNEGLSDGTQVAVESFSVA